jgi:murein DD-endopeptidase MepM/ murein hydrolase activator NlpD
LKRGWTKKVKAVPTCAASNDALQGRHCKSVQPKLKRRVRTSVAIVGLVISMGAPNLLLTRQSDRAPAAEAISNEPTANSAPVTTTEAAKNESVNLVEPKAVEPVSVAASSLAVEQLNQPVQPKAEVLPPVSPVIESVQKEPSLEQAQNYQVKTNSEKFTIGANQRFREVAGVRVSKLTKPHAIALDKKAGISGYNKPQPPAIQAEKVVRIQRENRLVQKLKARQIETLSQPPSVELQRTEIAKTPAIVVTPLLAESAVTVNAEVNPKQRALINRLKQTSNPAKDSLTELNAQAAPSPVITPLAQPNTTLTSPSRNEASVNSIVVDTVEQNVAARSPIIVKSNEEPVFGLQQSPATPEATVGSLAVPLKAPPTEASINPVVVDTVKQQNVAQPSLDPISIESPEVDLQQLPAIPEATVADSELPLETPTDSSEAAISPTLESDTQAQDLVPSDVTSNENTVLEDIEITPEIVAGVPAVQDAKKELIAVESPAQDYQVKAGDTLSAIARQHKIQVSELIETNRLSDPDLIEINQNLKIPTSQASNGIGQTITIINRPPQSKTAASASNVASVFVIPPLSSANNSSVAYTGMGGSISDAAEQLTATPVDYETQVSLTNPQDLQTDIQKLRQKYYAQHRASQLMPVVNETVTVPTSAQVPAPTTVAIPAQRINPQVRSLKSVNEPINPEFRVAQAVPTSQAKTKARVATAASGLDASESIQTLRGRQVSPELPPLGGVDTYLPKPNSTPLKGYIWPAKGVLTSGYGWRWGRMHKGIDIAAPIGTPILAAAPGVVVRSGWNSGGYGKLVEIKHTDGTITRYAHNHRLRVQAGQAVEQGQQISDMGSTGFSTGPHLHFEVHPGGRSAVNPIAFLPKRVTSRR